MPSGGVPTSENSSTEIAPTSDPSIEPSIETSIEPSSKAITISAMPSRRPTKSPFTLQSSLPSNTPSRLPLLLFPSNHPTTIIPTAYTIISQSPSLLAHFNNDTKNSILNISQNNIRIKVINIAILFGLLFFIITIVCFCINFRNISKYFMNKFGYNYTRSINHKVTDDYLQVSSLEECIEHFWKYRGITYKIGTITDDLFTRYGCPVSSSYENKVLNALHIICKNSNLLCPMSYERIICLMVDKKSENIRSIAYNTLLQCTSLSPKCVTVGSIQLLMRILVDSRRPKIKERAITILYEIVISAPNIITFDIYEMLQSHKHTLDIDTSHLIDMTLNAIRKHCIQLHQQINDYEQLLIKHSHISNIESVSSIQSCNNLNDNSILFSSDPSFEIHPSTRYDSRSSMISSESKKGNCNSSSTSEQDVECGSSEEEVSSSSDVTNQDLMSLCSDIDSSSDDNSATIIHPNFCELSSSSTSSSGSSSDISDSSDSSSIDSSDSDSDSVSSGGSSGEYYATSESQDDD
jgi:hypothetical protein